VAIGDCLGDVLADLAARFPGLADTCIEGRRLQPSFMASLDGRRFVTAPETPLSAGEPVLLFSVDAGG
jgi:hypothetical protein